MGNHRFQEWGPSDELELSYEHGGPHLIIPGLHICAACRHLTEMTWEATGSTHRVNRRGVPATITVGLCAHCWGELLIDDED